MISGGGETSTSGVIGIADTIGQSSPLQTTTAATFTIQDGFWVDSDIMPNVAYSAELRDLDSFAPR